MTSRDPGRIEKAFPSRARNIMSKLQEFDAAVRSSVTYNPAEAERRNALAAEGSVTNRSRRSPSRPSAATRQSLTGVAERPDIQGWTSAEAMPHLCFPPDQYPQGVGPGSQWTCRCSAVWVADGIAWDEYPTDPSRSAQPLKPERWHYAHGGQPDVVDYQYQEGLYDWRPLGPYYVRLYRAMIDNQLQAMGMTAKAPVTWEELG